MKAEQADSIGTGAVPRSSPRPQRTVPAVWLNLICLDAPLVAIVWMLLFARAFHVPIQVGNAVALFLTAWLIYLADRLADSFWLKPGMPRSLRHDFCLRHREIWTATVMLAAGFDAYVVWRATAPETFLAGAIVGSLALIYLALNHPFGRIWRSVPAKELAIGFLFAAGTLVALVPDTPALSAPFITSALAFAILCSLNCISIAGWERDLDQAQGKISIATRFPTVARLVSKVCVLVGVVCFLLGIAMRAALPIFACIGASALLLAGLNKEGRFTNRPRRFGNRGSLDLGTALADAVLLTPLIALPFLR